MEISLRPMDAGDIEPIVELSLLAWEPVFESFRRVLGDPIFFRQYPDWRTSQAAMIEEMCRDTAKNTVWVAERGGAVAGFIMYELNTRDAIGEVQLLAVHPAHQRRGVATALNALALQRLKEQGMRLAAVGTGGDPGHAPARAAYEKAGYTALPLVRYYQSLGDE